MRREVKEVLYFDTHYMILYLSLQLRPLLKSGREQRGPLFIKCENYFKITSGHFDRYKRQVLWLFHLKSFGKIPTIPLVNPLPILISRLDYWRSKRWRVLKSKSVSSPLFCVVRSRNDLQRSWTERVSFRLDVY